MINKNFTKEYALALLSLAKEEKKILKYKQDASDIIEVIKENDKFMDLLSLKNISIEEKKQIIKKAFFKIEENINKLILILINKAKIKWLESILLKLITYINKKLKIKEGIVYSVSSLSPLELKKIENFVVEKKQTKIKLKNLIDKSLISGVKVVVDDNIIEDNVLSRLEEMKRKLLGRF